MALMHFGVIILQEYNILIHVYDFMLYNSYSTCRLRHCFALDNCVMGMCVCVALKSFDCYKVSI